MLRTTAIAKELAVIERKLQETTNKTLKDALKKKQARLKDELNDYKKSTPALAKQLLAQRAQIKQLSKMDFNDLIRRLSKKPEYSFLRTMSKSTIKTDIERPAKPVGWRFKGRGNYDKPTVAEIKKGKRNGTVYREVRPLRSDVSQPLRLENGGTIKIGDKVKLNDDGVIRTYTVTEPGMRHPSERLQEGDVYLTSPGVIGFDASIDWVKQNMIHDKMETGGGIESKKKITLNLDSLTDSTYFNSSYGTFRYGYNDVDVVVNMVNKEYGYAKMKGKFAVINVEGEWIEGRALNKLIFNTKAEAVSYINDKLTDEDNKFGKGGNMKNTHMMEDGGVVGQEIVFDDNGETNTGVIKEIHEITGDYIVSTDDDRTVLAQKEFDVISLGKMRKQPEAKKRFMFFEDGGKMVKGGNLDSKSLFDLEYGDVFKIDRNPKRPHTMTGQYFLFIGFSEKYAKSEGVTIEAAYFPGSFYGAKYDQYKEHAYLGGLKNGDITIISKSEAGEMLLDYYLQNDKFEDGGNIAKENNEMLHSQAKEAKHHIEELHNIINNKTKVEPWVVAKMTRAKTDLSDITHYLEGASHKMAKGGKLTDEQQNKFDKVMQEWKAGKLHSGSANGPIVKEQDQAIAIAYSEAYGMDKMLFGGMVNELSDSAIDRMEGLAPVSTLQELLDNAKYIIADMENEGFEKDEVMSFLAYKISRIGSGKMMQSVSQVQQWTMEDENALTGWISDIQDGYGWITPGYVEDSWTSRPGSGTKEWNGDIQQRVYKRLIDENMLFVINPNDYEKKGKKIKDVTTAIWSAAEENGYENGGKMQTGGEVRKAPFKVGDMVYSYQNPNHKMRVSFIEDRGVIDGVDYGWGIKVALKTDSEGNYDPKGTYSKSSKWMSQNSVSKVKKEKYSQGGGVGKYDYDYEDIGQFSVADSEWKNYSQEDFRRMGKKIVKEKYNGDLSRAYNSVVRKNKMAQGGGVGKGIYTVAGRPVTLNEGKKTDGTDWTVTFENGKSKPLADVLSLIKPMPKGITMMQTGGKMSGWKHRMKC